MSSLKILMLNQDWFAEEFRELGHLVKTCGIRSHLDYELSPFEHIHEVLKRMDWYTSLPDLVIIHDESSPWYFVGLEALNIPIVFYSVDIHHHHEAHISMASACDYTFVAQKDYLSLFNKTNSNAEWFPLWPSVYLEPEKEKEYGAVFVGTLDKKLNPERVDFFDKLKKEVPIHVCQGNYKNYFSKAEIVVNQTVKGDLNFRVFETMMSGALLLTESSNNGLLELFEDKKHLVTYEKNNYKDVAEKINFYLSNKKISREIAYAGRDEVLKNHSPMSRAKTILSVLTKESSKTMKHFGQVATMNWATRGFLKENSAYGLKASKHSLRLISQGLNSDEPVSSEIIHHLVYACLKHDTLFKEMLGEQLLFKISEKFSEQHLPKVALIWKMLNRGENQNASNSLAKLNLDNTPKTLNLVNSAITEILAE